MFSPRLLFAVACLLLSGEGVAAVNSWSPASGPTDISYQADRLAVDPSNSSVVYVVDHVSGPQPDLLKKTADGGASWSTLPSVPAVSNMRSVGVVVHPTNSATLFFGLAGFTTPILVGGGAGLYKSIDGGNTWALSNFGLVSSLPYVWMSIAFDPVDPSVMYVVTQDGLYKSSDGAASWTRILQKTGALNVVVDPTNGSRIYVTAQYDVSITINGGSTWSSSQVMAPGTNSSLNSIAVDPVTPSTLYVGTNGGSDPTGAPVPGFLRSTDSGSTWTPTGGGLVVGRIVAIPGTQTTLMVTGFLSSSALPNTCGIFRSLDAGKTFVPVNDGLPTGVGVCPTLRALGNSASNPNLLYTLDRSANSSNQPVAGVFALTNDPSVLTPTCYLSASPTLVAEGASSTLSVYCSPAATSYAWSANTGFSSTVTGGSVTPPQTTTYTVQGTNANGAGNVATVTVTAPGPRLYGISTRALVLTGDSMMIAGLTIGGNTPKTVVLRARGPSLGIAGALADPTITLVDSQGHATTNDDWQTDANASAVSASGFAPANAKESALLRTLNPGAYTAIVSGTGGTTGIAIVEAFEIDHGEVPLTGISTRGQVQGGDNVLIGGFVVTGSGPVTVVIRGRGPSLASAGIANPLANPKLQVFSAQALIAENDDWMTDPNAPAIQSAGFAPTDPAESAVMLTLNPGLYTAIVSGVNSSGIGIVEVFAR